MDNNLRRNAARSSRTARKPSYTEGSDGSIDSDGSEEHRNLREEFLEGHGVEMVLMGDPSNSEQRLELRRGEG